MNKTEFKIEMIKNHDNQTTIAEAMGLPQSAISARINGTTEFKQNEIYFLMKRWNLSEKRTIDIFFTDGVSKIDTIEKGA